MRKVVEFDQEKTRNVKQQPRMDTMARRFDMIGQLSLEIAAWLRDAFDLE